MILNVPALFESNTEFMKIGSAVRAKRTKGVTKGGTSRDGLSTRDKLNDAFRKDERRRVSPVCL